MNSSDVFWDIISLNATSRCDSNMWNPNVGTHFVIIYDKIYIVYY